MHFISCHVHALQDGDESTGPSFAVTAVSAGTAGALISVVLCPTELIKVRG